MMMYYRKDLFEEYEIDPKDLKTWEDFRIVGQELMDDHAQRFLALDGTLFDVFLDKGAVTCFQMMENFCRMKILHWKSLRNLQRWHGHRLP